MQNLYNKPDLTHSELIVALEDYTYDSKVKCYIPSLMPLLSNNKIVEGSTRVNVGNVMNKKIDILGIGRYSNCNYIEVFIPSNLCNSESQVGYKGDQFAAIFLGGDINKCTVIGRYR